MVRDRDGRPPRGPSGSAMPLCVVGVHCWETSLGLADPWNVSILLIYPRIFLCVFIAYRLLVRFLCVWLYSAICSCKLVVLVKLSVLAKWLAIQRPLWWHLHEVRRLSSQCPGGEHVCVFFLFCFVCFTKQSLVSYRRWHILMVCISGLFKCS